MIKIKSPKEIDLMRQSGHLAARILREAAKFAKVGVTTNEINTLVHSLTLENNAYPSPLNYHGFPKSVCTSVNNVVTHGIPSSYILKEGDILNIDVTCNLNGYHGDTSCMVTIGSIPDSTQELIDTTYLCLQEAISIVRPGNFLNEIGNVIQEIADQHNYGVVREYCGHGIGRNFHEDPLVLHYSTAKKGPKFAEGMVFTIEPMINIGNPSTCIQPDGWTVLTKDGSLSAQFEHTVAVTSDSCEILTPFLENY